MDEIVPIEVKVNRKETAIFAEDEYIGKGTIAEGLGKLQPPFKADGTVTAGNAAGINDAAAVVLMKESKAKTLGLKPRVRLVDAAAAGVDPAIMGIGPVPVFRKLLEKTGIKQEDIGVIELNKAFASQTVACINELGLNEDLLMSMAAAFPWDIRLAPRVVLSP